jgi:probable HAF family extracellular repeat protein
MSVGGTSETRAANLPSRGSADTVTPQPCQCLEALLKHRTARYLSLLAGLASMPALAGPDYLVRDLGGFGGNDGAAAFGISEAGWVVGASDTPEGVIVGFVWDGDQMWRLDPIPGGDYARAVSVNSAGQVVGTSTDADGHERAVIWEQAGGVWTVTDLGTLPGGATANANRINESGQVVGRAASSFGPYHAFLYSGGDLEDLGKLHYPDHLGYSEALGLNDAGHVAGYAYAPLWGPDHAFYDNGEGPIDITPPGQFTFARGYGINNQDTIGGTTILPGGQSTGFEASLWTAGSGWVDIGVVPGLTESEGYDLNDNDEVVGRSFDLAVGDFRGFVYTGGQVLDLNAVAPGAPAKIVEAWAINDAGQIAAVAVSGDRSYALLLSPQDACYPDLNNDGAVDFFDFLHFQNMFHVEDPRADCEANGIFNLFDFLCFVNAFNTGC